MANEKIDPLYLGKISLKNVDIDVYRGAGTYYEMQGPPGATSVHNAPTVEAGDTLPKRNRKPPEGELYILFSKNIDDYDPKKYRRTGDLRDATTLVVRRRGLPSPVDITEVAEYLEGVRGAVKDLEDRDYLAKDSPLKLLPSGQGGSFEDNYRSMLETARRLAEVELDMKSKDIKDPKYSKG